MRQLRDRLGRFTVTGMFVAMCLITGDVAEGQRSEPSMTREDVMTGLVKPSMELKEGMEFLIEIPVFIENTLSTNDFPLYPAY